MNLDHVLTLLIVVPLAGLIPLAFFMRDERAAKQVAVVTTFAELLLSIVMLSQFHLGDPGFQLHEKIPWIPGLGVSYELGVDGLSVLLIPMTTLLTFLSVLYSSGGAIKTRPEMRQGNALDDDAKQHRGRNREGASQQERAGIAKGGSREVRAHHVERAVCEIHEIHDPEHQRQAGGQQEQQNAELQAVQYLREKEADGHVESSE